MTIFLHSLNQTCLELTNTVMVNPTELIKLEMRSIVIQISERDVSCKKPSLTAAMKSLRVMTHVLRNGNECKTETVTRDVVKTRRPGFVCVTHFI